MKKTARKIISLLLAVTMIFGAVGIGISEIDFEDFALKASAADEIPTSGTCGLNVTWSFDFDSGRLVINGIGEMTDWNGNGEVPWYEHKDYIETVVIGNGVTRIGDYSFYGCGSLRDITIPDSVNQIGSQAFWHTEYIDDKKNWTGEFLYLGDHLIRVDSSVSGEYAIKDGTKSIAGYAFDRCSELTGIVIPNSVKYFGKGAFFACDSLIDVYYSGDAEDWCGIIFDCSEYNNGSTPMRYAKNVYFYGELVTDLTIPSGITQINDYAFWGFDRLNTVFFPEGLEIIGSYAFAICGNLQYIYLPSSLELVKDDAFINTSAVVYFAGNIADWCKISFHNERSRPIGGKEVYINGEIITDLIIPEGVKEIGAFTFCRFYSIKSISIPSSVKNIGEMAFAWCSSLEEIHVSPSNGYYCVEQDTLFSKDKTKLIVYSNSSKNLVEYTVPSTVTHIYEYAFCRSSHLKKIFIPSSVLTIGEYAFRSCLKLEDLSFDSELKLKTIKRGTFIDCYNLKQVVVPNGISALEFGAFGYCDNLESVIIPKSVTSIKGAFYGSENLKVIYYCGSEQEWNSITLSENGGWNDTLINATVHYNYNPNEISSGFVYVVDENLEVTINDFIGQISGALVIPDMIDGYPVTSIGGMAFSYLDMDKVIFNCTHLETIGDGAFTGCANLTEITIPDGVTSIGASGFSYNDNLTTVNIPESVEYIGESCFEYNGNLTTVNWGTATLTEIKESTFEGCAVLEEITIPPYVTHIGEFGFAYCENLVTVINDAINLMGIGDNAFTGCVALQGISGTEVLHGYIGPGYSVPDAIAPQKVILPYGLETIGSRAFENCVSIKSISIPATVKTIGESAFGNCTGIEEVNYMGTGLGWNSIDIHSGNSLLYPESLCFKGSLIYSPSTTNIKYGETLGLHANTDGLPEGAKIEWSAEGDAVSLKPAADGKACGVVSKKSGEAVVKATVVDANGKAVLDANGEEISSTQKITSKAGLWERIVSFFKNLFRINRVIPQSVKMFF